MMFTNWPWPSVHVWVHTRMNRTLTHLSASTCATFHLCYLYVASSHVSRLYISCVITRLPSIYMLCLYTFAVYTFIRLPSTRLYIGNAGGLHVNWHRRYPTCKDMKGFRLHAYVCLKHVCVYRSIHAHKQTYMMYAWIQVRVHTLTC